MNEEIRNEEVDVTVDEVVDDFEDFDFEEENEKKSVFEKGKDLGKSLFGKVKDGIEYVKENPEEAAEKAFGVAAIGGTVVLVLLGLSSARKLDRTVYSEDIGECVELKKKLTNKDKTELDYRMKTGQTKIEALNDMNLVK